MSVSSATSSASAAPSSAAPTNKLVYDGWDPLPALREALVSAGIAPLPVDLFASVDPTPFVDAAFKVEAEINDNKDCRTPEVKYVHPGVAGMLDLFCDQVKNQITDKAHTDLFATVHLYVECRKNKNEKAKDLPRLPDDWRTAI